MPASLATSSALRRLLVTTTVVLALAVTGGAVHAQSAELKKARSEFDDLRFEDAEATLARALKSGKNGPSDLAAIFMLSAEIASARGDDDGTEAGFTRALAIKPEAPLPPGSSPKVAQQFAKARGWIDENGAVTIRYEGDRKAHLIRITVEKDKLGLVDSVVVIYTDDGDEERAKGGGSSPFEIPLPRSEALEVRIIALDEYGNRVQEIGTERDPVVIATDGDEDAGRIVVRGNEPRRWYAKWWLWGGVAVAAAGAGTVFGLGALSAEDDAAALIERSKATPVPYSDLDAIETRGKRNALLANVSFVAAGALAGFAVYLFLTDPGDGTPAREAESAVVPTIGDGQVGLTWIRTF